jgi:hypothetical protein
MLHGCASVPHKVDMLMPKHQHASALACWNTTPPASLQHMYMRDSKQEAPTNYEHATIINAHFHHSRMTKHACMHASAHSIMTQAGSPVYAAAAADASCKQLLSVHLHTASYRIERPNTHSSRAGAIAAEQQAAHTRRRKRNRTRRSAHGNIESVMQYSHSTQSIEGKVRKHAHKS